MSVLCSYIACDLPTIGSLLSLSFSRPEPNLVHELESACVSLALPFLPMIWLVREREENSLHHIQA